MIKKFGAVVFTTILLIAATGCQTVSPKQAEQKVKTTTKFKPDEKCAQVFVAKEDSIVGFAISLALSVQEKGTGGKKRFSKMDSGDYYLLKLSPGDYSFVMGIGGAL